MSSLDEHIKQIISGLNDDNIDDTLIRSLLIYPVDLNYLNFTLRNEEFESFYTTHLPRIMLELLVLLKTERIYIINLVGFCTKHSKADSWLDCLIQYLKVDNMIVRTFILNELDRYFFKLNRLVDFHKLCIQLPTTGSIWDQRCRMLSRIPLIVQNLSLENLGTKLSNVVNFVNCLLQSCQSLDSSSSNDKKWVGLIISHLGLSGYANEVSNFINNQTISDETKIWNESLKHVKNQSLEICLVPIIRNCSNIICLHRLLFYDIETDLDRLRSFLKLFSRLCFVRYFSSGLIIRKIFSALSLCVKESNKLEDCNRLIRLIDEQFGKPLFELWADYSAIQSTTIERHIYVSQILLSWLTDFRSVVSFKLSIDLISDGFLSNILNGISNHLSSPRKEINFIGMIMGEWMVKNFNWSNQSNVNESLKFDYDEDSPIIGKIRPYFVPLTLSSDLDKFKGIDDNECVNEITNLDLNKSNKLPIDSDDAESDEENELFKPLPDNPFHLKLKYSNLKKPRYLRECLDGMMLTKTEDNMTNLACTMTAEELIYAHPVPARELAVEFARVLVHIEAPATPYSIEVSKARHRALVAVGVVAPIECARYLTSEFCQSDYSIGQRLSIISAISDIACRLSGLDKTLFKSIEEEKACLTDRVVNDPILFCLTLSNSKSNHVQNDNSNKTSVNKFAQVAGEFFFPLLQSIPQLCSSSIRGTFRHQDASVLASLVAALATLFACARFGSVQSRMASELFDLIPLLHEHCEPAVRRALFIAVGTVVTHLPSSVLSANPQLIFGKKAIGFNNELDLFNDESFILNWLKSSIMNESDTECRQLAKIGLAALCEKCSALTL